MVELPRAGEFLDQLRIGRQRAAASAIRHLMVHAVARMITDAGRQEEAL